MIYIEFNEGGSFRAFHDTDKDPELPEGAIPLTPEQVAEIEQDVTQWRLDTGTQEVYRIPQCAERYRKSDGTRVVEMTPEEKEVVDTAEAEREAAAAARAAEFALQAELSATDAGMGRVLEDLIAALKAKGVITDSDLPQEARDKIVTREEIRERMKK